MISSEKQPMSESTQTPEDLEEPLNPESIRQYLLAGQGGAQNERDAEANEIAGIYLKKAALAFARELLANPAIHINDDWIARVEILLRAARHMCRTSNHNGDPIPSVQKPDGSRIPLTARLLQLMNRDQVIQAENDDDYKSPSKASKATKEGRDARAKITETAEQVVREGEIVA
jgi:hypothetical protein